MSIKSLLRDEIQREFEKLNEMEVGSDQHKAGVDAAVKLVDRAIEMEKIDIDLNEKTKVREDDISLKVRSMDEERKDRLIKNGIAVASIVVPTIVTIWGTIKSIEFEKEGTFTTIMGRGFINKLLPKK